MEFKDLTPEEQEMVSGKSPEEIFELAKKLGRKLTDEEIEQVAGGAAGWCVDPCPKCGSRNTGINGQKSPRDSYCNDCGHRWETGNI